jgi:YVTN family beta-propeller protein
VDPANDHVFVVDDDSASVSIIDGSSNKVIGTASVGAGPGGAAFDSANGYVYVANSGTNDVSVLSGSSGSVVTTIAVGVAPWGVAYDSAYHDVYVTDVGHGYEDGNVSVIDGSMNTVAATIPLWDYPYTITFDPANNLLYTANVYSAPIGNVSITNGTSQKAVGTVGAGVAPSAIAFDSNSGNTYVADWGNNEVAVVNSSSNERIGAIAVGFGPRALALDAVGGRLYVANFASNNVTEVNTSTGRVAASAPVGSGPIALAYDPSNHQVYAVNFNSDNVTVLNGSTLAQVGSIPVGQRPAGIVYVAENGHLVVTDSGPYSQGPGNVDNVTVIDGSTDRATASVPVGAVPWGVAYDPMNHLSYVANYFAGNLTLIDAGTFRTVGSIHIGLYPIAVAYDPVRNEVDVAFADSVAFVDARTNTILGSIFVGEMPGALAIDPISDHLFVGNLLSGTLSILQPTVYPPPKFNVGFFEFGLPTGTYGTVTLNATWLGSTSVAVIFSAVNGLYDFTVSPVPGYTVSPSSGSVVVNYSDLIVTINFTSTYPVAVLYSVTFEESGLPTGWEWTVIWNGSGNSSNTSSMTFRAANGSYSFAIAPVAGRNATPSEGATVVSGSNVTQTVLFAFPFTPAPTIVSFRSANPTVEVGASATWIVVTSGGLQPFTYDYTGLPAGCTSENLSVLTCSPSETGTFRVTVTVSDAVGRSAWANTTLTVAGTGSRTGPAGYAVLGMAWWVIAASTGLAAAAILGGLHQCRRARLRSRVMAGPAAAGTGRENAPPTPRRRGPSR